MNKKPDRQTAMRQLLTEVKQAFPLYEPETFVCGPDNKCIGCPRKLLELVDTEVSYWEHAIERGVTPQFDEIRQFGKLCKNVRRGLMRNNIMT